MREIKVLIVLMLVLVSYPNMLAQDMFRKDWTWKYEREDRFQDTYYRFSMTFGDEVEANGHLWHEFKTISSQCCIRDYETGEFYEENYFDLPCTKCYYVREENGEWYVLCYADGCDIETQERFLETKQFTEELIYDFNCNLGESFVALEYETICCTDIIVNDNFMVNIDGVERRCLSYSFIPFYVIEGIGPLAGILAGLKAVFFTGWGDHIRQDMPQHGFAPHLVDVVDSSGVSILDKVLPQLGIEPTFPDPKIASGIKYDIFGREIENPTPGTLYIQSGRKYISK